MEKTEQWPLCHHGIEMDFVLQVDHADALHTTTFSGIYTVFKCAAPLATRLADHRSGRICQPCIRHYPNPDPDLPMPKQVTIQKNEVTIFRPVKAIDFLPSIHLLDSIAVMHDLEIDDQCYKWMQEQGWSSRVYEDHLGGWHATNWDREIVPLDCKDCSDQLQLVSSFEWGDGNRSLWACPLHPREAYYTFHK